MKSHYHNNYIDSIYIGLKDSLFFIDNKEVEGKVLFNSINTALKVIHKNKNRVFFFGNGASSAFANHMALDFSKNGKILSRSLSDSSMLTALSNDYSYDEAMLEFLKIENPTKKDLIITISSSGNSNNVVNVLEYCKSKSLKTLALSGLSPNNKSIKLSDFSIYSPMKTYGMVECIHQIFLHLILDNFMKIEEWNRDELQNMNSSNFKL